MTVKRYTTKRSLLYCAPAGKTIVEIEGDSIILVASSDYDKLSTEAEALAEALGKYVRHEENQICVPFSSPGDQALSRYIKFKEQGDG